MSNTPQSIQPSGRTQAGFTLIEVLIAIVVLVFGLIAITNLFLVAGSSNTVANQATASADAAAQVLENLKAQPWTSAQLAAGGNLTTPTAPYTRLDMIPGVGRIQTNWLITDVDVRTKFIRVRSEGLGVLARARSRAEFTTYRTCTTPNLGCP
jgi:prepilin-type N-terminal cleavage/methylation domain-containing protein